jgi:hypothetical protein
MTNTENTIDIVELTARLGLPESEQDTVLAWTNEQFGHEWTESEVAELLDIWAADTERIASEG